MLAIISPAKTLDFESPSPTRKHSLPVLLAESKRLIDELRQKAPQDIADLMGISSKLADLNYDRYAVWNGRFSCKNAKQAMLAFKGDVYMGLEAETYSERDFAWAQKHVRILSGLHGILKPLDLIQPYRLEMGTQLETDRGNDLYQFWGDRVTECLNEAISEQRQPLLINLASVEYFNVIDAAKIDARIITPKFLDLKNGRYKFLSFFAKKARGAMTSYIVKHRVSTLSALKSFDWHGYRYNEDRSTADEWIFLRNKPLRN
ncbi:MAG: peroxide stress protein YaaA [Gammaproteobacteria bacterium]|nr:peroxide stress protein YaaA [Gammaproteobacteria bacterium]